MTVHDDAWAAKRDLECRSSECRSRQHDGCDGHYGTSGSSLGYDTFVCHCACHSVHPSWLEDDDHGAERAAHAGNWMREGE